MDLNQEEQFSSSSPPLFEAHNFMNMPPRILPRYQQPSHEVGGESINSPFMQLQRQNLQLFWHQQMLEIYQLSEIKQHHLPLARIKRIMKLDEDVKKMISADTPVLFSKACELFILELTLRSWLRTEENRRRTLQKCDIANAVRRGEVLDFLIDIVPTDDHKDEEIRRNSGGTESLPVNGLHFPIMDMNQFHPIPNGEFMIMQQEIPQQFMIQQPISSSQLIYDSPPE
ncbi:hypothetical protein HHK36_024600 [Tetracentron sinense]|uniref:Transcription factor CBF/NF-Y/archaeal histone domain-containing protein n=1 Tax=Tetracentron sinense TaxID=13715 RepID=A0A835D7M2_TETSI|nr:hypothetical protein HHK36_024600 [Tetracentron sinense]